MENPAFTSTDLALLAIMIVSGLLAMMRGFTMEVLSILAFILSAVIALFLLPWLRPFAPSFLPGNFVGDVALVGVVFAIALVPLWVFCHRLAVNVQGSTVGPLDRSFGFVFGIARALVVVGIGFLLFTRLIGDGERPQWIEQARLLPVVEATSDLLGAFFPAEDAPAFSEEKGYTQQEIRDKERLIEQSLE
jgi:membrane protein required for colicin V production